MLFDLTDLKPHMNKRLSWEEITKAIKSMKDEGIETGVKINTFNNK